MGYDKKFVAHIFVLGVDNTKLMWYNDYTIER